MTRHTEPTATHTEHTSYITQDTQAVNTVLSTHTTFGSQHMPHITYNTGISKHKTKHISNPNTSTTHTP